MICADELGPVIPRSVPPAPAWTLDGHRVKALLDYGRGPEKTWVYGALRVGDGQEVTMTAPSRNSVGYQRLLAPAQPEAPAHWTLDTLAEAAQAEGIAVGRSQVRRILLAERVRWRRTRSWATSTDADFVPKGPRSSPATPPRRRI